MFGALYFGSYSFAGPSGVVVIPVSVAPQGQYAPDQAQVYADLLALDDFSADQADAYRTLLDV